MRVLIFFLLIALFSCTDNNQNPERVQGVWIPETIDWDDGSFKFLFIRDTAFTQISSTQSKDDKDSIYFMTEPGYNLSAGTIHVRDTVAVVSFQDLYKHVPLISDKFPSSIKIDTIYFNKGNSFILYQGKPYKKTNMFKRESKDIIDSIAINFVQFLKKKQNISPSSR
jgi:hypothetical protein